MAGIIQRTIDRVVGNAIERNIEKALNSFNWSQAMSTQRTNSKYLSSGIRPVQRDLTEQFVVNSTLTRGIWHNTFEGMKLAGSLAYVPVNVPVQYMGLPIPQTISGNDAEDAELSRVVDEHREEMRMIHLQCHREGTIWIWPYFDPKKRRVLWEFIPDDSVPTIIKDIQSSDVLRIYTDEMLTVQIGDMAQRNIRRKRMFESGRYTISYDSALPAEVSVKQGQFRNPIGILPIPFANDADGDEIRGHSEYERILSDLKAYHDLEQMILDILTRFKPKMVVGAKDIDAWMTANQITDISDFDLYARDLVLAELEERLEFVFPEGATDAYFKQKEYHFLKLVEATGIPEIAWGVKTEGNHASAEEQMAVLTRKVDDKREQKNQPYMRLFAATRTLESMAGMRVAPDMTDLRIGWNELDNVSDEVRSQIYKNFSEGTARLLDTAGLTMEQLHKLWQMNFPKASEQDFAEFEAGLAVMAKHRREVQASVNDLLDMAGADPMDDDIPT